MNSGERSWNAITFCGNFARGLFAPVEGFLYFVRHSQCWPYAIWPFFLHLLFFVVAVSGLILSLSAAAIVIHTWTPEGYLWRIAEVGILFLTGISLVAMTIAVWFVLNFLFCGSTYQKLAKLVEQQLGNEINDENALSWSEELKDVLVHSWKLIAKNLLLLLLILIPFVGPLLVLVLSFVINCRSMGADYLDLPLSLRGMQRSAKRDFIKQHAAKTMGFGAVIFVLNFIPVFGSLLLTTSVVGAVLLHHRITSEEATTDE